MGICTYTYLIVKRIDFHIFTYSAVWIYMYETPSVLVLGTGILCEFVSSIVVV